jgi:CheY-like chemotaxis protein
MRVLLVDDDELVRFTLTEMLSDAGHEVMETGDPHHALDPPEAFSPPDVLITDIDLRSGLNGFECGIQCSSPLARSADYPDKRASCRSYRAISRST